MIKTGYFLIKKIIKKKYYQFFFFSWIMLAHILSFDGHWMKKHLISSLCYTSVKLTFSPTPPSQRALLRYLARL